MDQHNEGQYYEPHDVMKIYGRHHLSMVNLHKSYDSEMVPRQFMEPCSQREMVM